MSSLMNLDPQIKQVLNDRDSAPSFKKMQPGPRLTALNVLLVKISVITGWSVPSAEIKQILIDQWNKLITDRYSFLNPVEMESAFREFGTRVPDYGKEMNLSLFAGVLDLYTSKRQEAERSASHKSEKVLKIDPMTDEQLINEARGQIAFYYEQRKKGNNRPRIFPFWAEVLKMDGFIECEDDVEIFFNKCLENKKSLIYFKD